MRVSKGKGGCHDQESRGCRPILPRRTLGAVTGSEGLSGPGGGKEGGPGCDRSSRGVHVFREGRGNGLFSREDSRSNHSAWSESSGHRSSGCRHGGWSLGNAQRPSRDGRGNGTSRYEAFSIGERRRGRSSLRAFPGGAGPVSPGTPERLPVDSHCVVLSFV